MKSSRFDLGTLEVKGLTITKFVCSLSSLE